MYCGAAANYQDAVTGIRNLRPDIVLIDVMLRGKPEGIAVGDFLIHHTDISFIYTTAHDDEKILTTVRCTLPDGFLLKPYDMRQLNAAINLAQLVE